MKAGRLGRCIRLGSCFCLLLLSGCLQLEVNGRIEASGQVSLDLDYYLPVLSRQLLEGSLYADYLPLASTEASMRQRAEAAGGSLATWTARSDHLGSQIACRLVFPSLAAAVAFFDSPAVRVSHVPAEAGQLESLRLSLEQQGRISEANRTRLIELLSGLYPDHLLRISLSLPRPGRAATGFSLNANQAVFQTESHRLFVPEASVVLELSW